MTPIQRFIANEMQGPEPTGFFSDGIDFASATDEDIQSLAELIKTRYRWYQISFVSCNLDIAPINKLRPLFEAIQVLVEEQKKQGYAAVEKRKEREKDPDFHKLSEEAKYLIMEHPQKVGEISFSQADLNKAAPEVLELISETIVKTDVYRVELTSNPFDLQNEAQMNFVDTVLRNTCQVIYRANYLGKQSTESKLRFAKAIEEGQYLRVLDIAMNDLVDPLSTEKPDDVGNEAILHACAKSSGLYSLELSRNYLGQTNCILNSLKRMARDSQITKLKLDGNDLDISAYYHPVEFREWIDILCTRQKINELDLSNNYFALDEEFIKTINNYEEYTNQLVDSLCHLIGDSTLSKLLLNVNLFPASVADRLIGAIQRNSHLEYFECNTARIPWSEQVLLKKYLEKRRDTYKCMINDSYSFSVFKEEVAREAQVGHQVTRAINQDKPQTPIKKEQFRTMSPALFRSQKISTKASDEHKEQSSPKKN